MRRAISRVLTSLLLACAAAMPTVTPVSAQPPPWQDLQLLPAAAAAALPQDRLHFGVGNSGDINWMVGTGVPWRYRYAYLAGGVNTPNPWQNWNSPPGAYATNYMNDSNAHGIIPVFTYYELLQSNPSTGANESDRDFSKLNNTSTMNAYYSNSSC